MALIVEDGTGLVDAESYCSVAFADTYHEKRGNAAWDVIDDKEALLRKATDYMLETYRHVWKGYRHRYAQALDWPRDLVYLTDLSSSLATQGYLLPNDQVPDQVKKACAELALKANSNKLNPDLTQQVLSKTVGPISVTYDRNSPQSPRFQAIDEALRALLQGNSLSAKVRRA